MTKIKTGIILLSVALLFSIGNLSGQERTWSVLPVGGSVTPRSGNGFMSCKGYFYLMGGEGIRSMDIFDPTLDRWLKGSPPPVEMHHFQAVRMGDEIYVLGAFTGTGRDESVLKHIYIYNTNNRKWRKGDRIPPDCIRGSCGVVSYRGMIYMIGGTRDRFRDEPSRRVDRYDPKTGKWKQLQDAPRARHFFHAAVCNGTIYAMSGYGNTKSQDQMTERIIPEVDMFDLGTRRWSTLPPESNLPTPRAGCSTVVIMDHVLVMGGESGAVIHSEVDAWDVEEEQWERWTDLNKERAGTQSFMCVGTVFIAGGRMDKAGGILHNSLEMLDY